METALQKSIKLIGLQNTIDKYKLISRRHKDFNNLVLLSYNMIESPMAEKIVQEARGIILDEDNNWEVVARGFDKFFNYGEAHCAPIDWNTASYYEKKDGSLLLLYYYKGWRVATTGSGDAGGTLNVTNKTFAETFWEVFTQMGGSLENLDQNHCYLFELCTPYNKIVVSHKDSSLTLLSIRAKDGQFQPRTPGIAGSIPWVQKFDLSDIHAALKSFDSFDGSSMEGYVIEDANHNKIKVKHPGYVALHHFMDHKLTSQIKLLDIVLHGEVSEVITYFPEYAKDFQDLEDRLNCFELNLDLQYQIYKGIETQKEFALAIKDNKYKSCLFLMRKNQCSVKDILKIMPLSHINDLI